MRIGKLFFGVLLAITISPPLALLAWQVTGIAAPSGASLYAFSLVAFGTSHVAATSYYYADPDYWPIMRAERGRFFGSLILIPVIFAAIYLLSPLASTLIFIPFLTWQFYHVGRQNYGMAALAASSSGFGKLPWQVNWTINLTAVAAALYVLGDPGTFAIGLTPDFLAPVERFTRIGGLLAFVGGLVLFIHMLATNRVLMANRRTLAFTAASCVFFLPVVLGAPSSGFMACNAAHASQYWIMTGAVARKRQRPIFGLAVLTITASALTVLFLFLYKAPLTNQLFFGLFAVHFLADAKIWRLREPMQRQILQQRMSYIFGPRQIATAPIPFGVPAE